MSNYSNDKYGFEVDYPSSWNISEESPSGDGVYLYEEDGNDIRTYGGYYPMGDGIDTFEIDEAKEAGIQVEEIETADSYFAEMILRAYEETVIDALNNNDFGRIEKYLIDDSEFFNQTKSMISEQVPKGEAYTLISYDIEDIVQHEDSIEEYDLYVKEKIVLYDENQNKSIEKTDFWIYTIISNEKSEGISKRTVWKTTE